MLNWIVWNRKVWLNWITWNRNLKCDLKYKIKFFISILMSYQMKLISIYKTLCTFINIGYHYINLNVSNLKHLYENGLICYTLKYILFVSIFRESLKISNPLQERNLVLNILMKI